MKLRNFLTVFGVVVFVSGMFMVMVPAGARSFDAFSWEEQAMLMAHEINPYQANTLFNWPPFWMQCVFLISKIAPFTHLPFFRVLQCTLIAAEGLAIWIAMDIVCLIKPSTDMVRLFIIGVALNPVVVFLVCQHCNFDIIAVIWILLAIRSLIYFEWSGRSTHWLAGCLFLGLGVLTKTFPLALAPLLVSGFKMADRPMRLIATALFIGPVALGMSVIYVLCPNEVFHHVLAYRGDMISFGFPGIIHFFQGDKLLPIYHAGFYLYGIIFLMASTLAFWSDGITPKQMVLFSAFVLLAIPTIGNGGAQQYLCWSLIPLVICHALYPELRKTLGIYFVVAALSFIADYGLLAELGYNWLYIATGALNPGALQMDIALRQHPLANDLMPLMLWFNVPEHKTLEHIPLFGTMLWTCFKLAIALTKERIANIPVFDSDQSFTRHGPYIH